MKIRKKYDTIMAMQKNLHGLHANSDGVKNGHFKEVSGGVSFDSV